MRCGWRLLGLSLCGLSCGWLERGDPKEQEVRRVPQSDVSHELRARWDARRVLRDLQDVSAPRAAGEERPPVLLMIVLDTFRADRLALWGGDPELAPALNELASQSLAFPQMVSDGAWTLPSHGSLFTGLAPAQHGATGSPLSSSSKALGLSETPPTLAERLKEAGWVTLGLAANRAFLQTRWGLSRGFDRWYCEELELVGGLPYIQGDRMTALTLEVFGGYEGSEPLFLFVNYMDTHTPWIPREGFTPTPEEIDPLLLPKGGQWKGRGSWAQSRREVLTERRAPSSAELTTWEQAYDAEVRYLDHQIQILLEGLQELGWRDTDRLVLLSDHGEFLGEHGLLEHSKGLYQETLRVPLLMKGPSWEPGLDERRVQTHDVPSLILSDLGLDPLPGWSLPGELQVSELYWGRKREMRSARLRRKFNRIQRAFQLDGWKWLVSEPGESIWLRAEAEAEVEGVPSMELIQRMETASEEWLTAHPYSPGQEVQLGDAALESLKALGYIE